MIVIISLGIGIYLYYKNKVSADVLSSAPTGKMAIESSSGNTSKRTISTTGATYVIGQKSIKLYRRINPKTNTNDPKQVAELNFSRSMGTLKVTSFNSEKLVVDSNLVSIEINADSFFLVTAKKPFNYTHKNIVANATYNKGSGLNRMWTDGYGGSLLAYIKGSQSVISQDTNSTKIQMPVGAVMSHMAYPPKKFDFEKLYGQNTKPIIQTAFYNKFNTTDPVTKVAKVVDLKPMTDKLQEYKDAGVGIIVVWSTYYDCPQVNHECKTPVELTPGGVLGYKIHPDFESSLNGLIQKAHQLNMKVVPDLYSIGTDDWVYPSGHPKAGQPQDIASSLSFMKSFQAQYDFDGWYLDGGAGAGTLLENYNFAKQLRKDVGDDGVIIYHDSVDAWANPNLRNTSAKYPGIRSVMLDAYADYSLAGETGDIAVTNSINDPYYRFFSSGYGLSQAIGMNARFTEGKPSILDTEVDRLMAGNLNGGALLWDQSNIGRTAVSNSGYIKFKPAYDVRKAEYLSGNFNPDVKWPIDLSSSWFRNASNVKVSFTNQEKTSVVVSWGTDENTTGVVQAVPKTWSKDRNWLIGAISSADSSANKSHSVTLNGLDKGVEYKYRIRSTNGKPGTSEVIWAFSGALSEMTSTATESLTPPRTVVASPTATKQSSSIKHQ